MRFELWCVINGNNKTWFCTREEAKAFVEYVFKYDDDGIPLVKPILAEHKRDIVNILNGEAP